MGLLDWFLCLEVIKLQTLLHSWGKLANRLWSTSEDLLSSAVRGTRMIPTVTFVPFIVDMNKILVVLFPPTKLNPSMGRHVNLFPWQVLLEVMTVDLMNLKQLVDESVDDLVERLKKNGWEIFSLTSWRWICVSGCSNN